MDTATPRHFEGGMQVGGGRTLAELLGRRMMWAAAFFSPSRYPRVRAGTMQLLQRWFLVLIAVLVWLAVRNAQLTARRDALMGALEAQRAARTSRDSEPADHLALPQPCKP
jgi:hypothetical protein